MILQALVSYYEALAARNEIVPLGWCMEKVSYALNITPDGELFSVIPLLTEVTVGKKKVKAPQMMKVPERMVRAVGIKANFICDNTAYLLGIDEKGKPDRAVACFESSKALHLTVLDQAKNPMAMAIKAFFSRWSPEKAREHPALQVYYKDMAAAYLVFMFDGDQFAQDDAEVCDCWAQYNRQASDQEDASALKRCLVTGRTDHVAVLHGKIKSIPGGQSAGMTLVGFNANAYESYGNKDAQGLNAPVSKYAAFAYVTALNTLLADKAHCRRFGDTTMVYWSADADPKPQEVFSFFVFPEPDTDTLLDGAMQNLVAGKPLEDVDMQKPFYVLGLAPNAARLSVRFFLRDTLGAMLEHNRQHYERLAIVKPAFDNRMYLSVPALLWETVNPKSRDKASSPLLSGAVMRAVLTGSDYPAALYTSVLTRIKADSNVSRGRAAIIKAFLIKNYKEERMIHMALNDTFDNRAYVLGRLFAVLEYAQSQANPDINTTVKDRYFTSACTTPGNVFPQLLRLSKHHTAKAKYGLNREIEKTQLLDKLSADSQPFPAHHSLQEQGLFILGYYHQVQHRFTKSEKDEKDVKDVKDVKDASDVKDTNEVKGVSSANSTNDAAVQMMLTV